MLKKCVVPAQRLLHAVFFIPVMLWILVYGNRKFDRELVWTPEAIKQWKRRHQHSNSRRLI